MPIGQFLRNNVTAIIILSLIIFTLLVIFASLNDNFKDVAPYDSTPPKQKGKVVTVEAFENTTKGALHNLSLPQAFCQQHQSRPHELEAQCNLLSPKACEIPSCCVLRNGKDCVAGDQRGPTFLGERTNFFIIEGHCKNGRGVCPG